MMGTVYYPTVFAPPLPVYRPTVRFVHPRKSRRSVVPDMITGVQITLVPNGEDPPVDVSIQIGANSYTRPLTYLFEHGVEDEQHLIGNIRLHRIIGPFASSALWSSEFLDSLEENGIKSGNFDYYSIGFAMNVDGSYEVSFSTVKGLPAYATITVAPGDLADDTHDHEMIIRNLRSFFRLAGYTDHTTQAPNGLYQGKTAFEAAALWPFRY